VEADVTLNYIIIEGKNNGWRKGYLNLDQTFRVDFDKLLFILIALKQIEILVTMTRSFKQKYSLPIPRKIHKPFRLADVIEQKAQVEYVCAVVSDSEMRKVLKTLSEMY
jgi:hypothetical protein